MDRIQLLQDYRATTRRQSTFNHYVSSNFWFAFDWPNKDERLSRYSGFGAILNPGTCIVY